ncbi:P1 family peptidase [Candidatus Burkholderia verschuerenii]|uniref:P1 family peptidase n=1 Tax=Candidatus Burkholderia verschuerenii TaxID=242163 RepID=UPI000AACEB3B
MKHIGLLKAGPRGTIADVKGVTVRHCTLDDGDVQTGVTVIRPHAHDVYRAKVPAARVRDQRLRQEHRTRADR